MPKLIVIDPCLGNMNGHEYAMNKFIVDEATMAEMNKDFEDSKLKVFFKSSYNL